MKEGSYSRTFMEWAAPLFQLLSDAPRSAAESALKIAITTWNAVTLEDAGIASDAIKELKEQLWKLPPPGPELFTAVVDQLIESRRTTYAEARWTIGKCELRGSGKKLRVFLQANAIPSHS